MTYLDTVWNGELGKLTTTTASRNNTLFSVGVRLYQFSNAGAWPEQAVTDELTHHAASSGLKAHEIRSTLTSARRRAGDGKPTDRHGRELDFSGNGTIVQTSEMAIEAPEPCDPPSAVWQTTARAFLDYAQDRLWDAGDPTGLDILEARGLNARTVLNGRLGYNPRDLICPRARWGIEPDPKHGDRLFLPAGIVIPYIIDRVIYRIEIRGKNRKRQITGSSNALWGADLISRSRPAMLVEGVFNALTVQQEAGDLVVPVAIGAATHARRVRWIVALGRAAPILVATDAGRAGEDAACYWLSVLGAQARRWRPYTDDPNTMLRQGLDVRAWVAAGLEGV